MKNILITVLAAATLFFGFTYFKSEPALPSSVPVQQIVGASSGTEHTNQENFYAGMTSARFSSVLTADATVSPATLGAAASGFIAIPVAGTLFNASSTQIGPNSKISFQQIASATASSLIAKLGSTLCNTAVASTTPLYRTFASSTNSSVNGFSVQLQAAPTGAPFCYSYRISDFAN